MQIKITEGSVAPEDISQKHLITNHLIDESKNIDKVIMYAETRHVMTMLTSGVRSSKYAFKGYLPVGADQKTVKTVMPKIPKGEMLSDNAWRWKVMGRIQKESVVVGSAAVGTIVPASSTSGGFFAIHLQDDYLKNQMNAIFPSGKIARVLGEPTRVAPNKFLYKFNTFAGETFSWDSWMLPKAGRKTIFGGYTTVGERSRRGYGNFHFPDSYVQHAAKQRKSFSISGDANTNRVLWYSVGDTAGFSFEAEVQLRSQMSVENEFQKQKGRSTMRDPYGNLLTAPSQYDENGEPIIAGDGAITQIEGSNDLEASGSNGLWTWDDLETMVKAIKKKRNYEVTEPIVCKTGDDGIAWLDTIVEIKAKEMNMQFMLEGDGTNQTLGYQFRKFRIAGEIVYFVEDPMQSDSDRYPARLQTESGTYGVEASTVYFLDFSPTGTGKRNIEIRSYGREGIDRGLYYSWFDGFTGQIGKKAQTPVDANEFHIFMQDAIAVYYTARCGILYPNLMYAG